MYKFAFFFLVLTYSFACKTAENAQQCDMVGTVVDHTGMDGCSFLIHTKDGKKLLPVSITDETFRLKDGQTISFSYTKVEDGVSICMMEDEMVKINCISEMEGGSVGKASSKRCKYEGVVTDESKIDGCGLMITLEDGTRLQPLSFNRMNYEMKAGQKVSLDYIENTQAMGICMRGKMVDVICIEVIE